MDNLDIERRINELERMKNTARGALLEMINSSIDGYKRMLGGEV